MKTLTIEDLKKGDVFTNIVSNKISEQKVFLQERPDLFGIEVITKNGVGILQPDDNAVFFSSNFQLKEVEDYLKTKALNLRDFMQ